MYGNFKPMLDELVKRGTITQIQADRYHEITTGGKDKEAYVMVKDFILENYYAETQKDIPKGT